MEGEAGLLTKEESRQKAALDSDGVHMIKTVCKIEMKPIILHNQYT